MARKPDWGALGALFQPPPPPCAVGPAPGTEGACVTYRGEAVPRWLARDLALERAAICEYDAGMNRPEAERFVRSALYIA